ncbi:MAG: Eco57I restriction-modification methylase domain-containing protein [Candidatus Hodarchaeales archaeon]
MSNKPNNHSSYTSIPESLIAAIPTSKQLEIANGSIDICGLEKSSENITEQINSLLESFKKQTIEFLSLENGKLSIYPEFGIFTLNTSVRNFFSRKNVLYVKEDVLRQKHLRFLFILDSSDKMIVFSLSDQETYLWWSPILHGLELHIISSICHENSILFDLNDVYRINYIRKNTGSLINLMKEISGEEPVTPSKIRLLYTLQREYKNYILENLKHSTIDSFGSSSSIEARIRELTDQFFAQIGLSSLVGYSNIHLLFLDLNTLTYSFIFPHLRPSELRGNSAAYYTPIELILLLINKGLEKFFASGLQHKKLRILDPSMGTGLILLFILEWLVQNPAYNCSSSRNILDLRKDTLLVSLHGNEIDNESLNLAKFLLSEFCSIDDYSFLKNLKHQDYLMNFINEEEKAMTVKYSLIITNPPYIALHSRFLKNNISPINRVKLGSLIPEFSGKRDNFYLFFLGVSLKKLYEGGIVSFVVDHSFFDLPSYKNVRKHILRNYTILYLLNEFDYRPEATVDLGIISLQNCIPSTDHNVSFQRNFSSNPKLLNQNFFFGRPNFSFDHIIGQDILDRILKTSVRLGDICKLSCGLEYGGLLKTNFLSSNKPSDKWFPVIDGSNSLPSKFVNFWVPGMPNSFVRFDKNYERLLTEGGKNFSRTGKKVLFISGDIDRFIKRKIVLRQSARRFIGIIDDKKYLTLRNTHVLYDVCPPYTLEFVLGFLSSSLANWIGINLNIIRSSGKSRYPQIRLKDLKRLPIPDLKQSNSDRNKLVIDLISIVKTSLAIGDQVSFLLTSIWDILVKSKCDYFKSQRKFANSCFTGLIIEEPKLSVKVKRQIEPLLMDIRHFLQELETIGSKIDSIVFSIASITQDERKIIEKSMD